MKKNIFNFRYVAITFLLLFFAFQVNASIFDNSGSLNGLPGQDFDAVKLFNLLKNSSCWLIRFAIIAIAIMIVVYGLLFLKSRGSAQGMTYAKKSLTWGIVGAVVIFGVFTIILSLAALIGANYPILTIISC